MSDSKAIQFPILDIPAILVLFLETQAVYIIMYTIYQYYDNMCAANR